MDLKEATDKVLLGRMLAQADVLVQNLAPGAMDRLGLDVATITRLYPHLISVSICGYGSDTPYAGMRAYDMLVQAESGICAITGTPKHPAKVGAPVADVSTGANAHAAVLEALIERSRTGRGQSIEIAMFDGLTDWMTVPFLHCQHGGTETGRHGLSHATVYPYRSYACSDGALIIAVQNNAQWQRLCLETLERPDLAKHAGFSTNTLRVKNRVALDAALGPVFAGWSVEAAIARCETGGIAWARYRSVAEMTTHPALRRTDITLENGTQIKVPRPAGRSADLKAGALPALGQHSQAIRREFE